MFTNLRIKNFKRWEDTGPIRMAPVTLLFGANSSGKSSIGQFLMMLKQTVSWSDRRAVFYPGDQNTPVQLGSYQEMVFHRDAEKRIEFEYRWHLDEALEINDPLSKKAFNGRDLNFEARVGLNERDKNTLVLDHLKYDLYNSDNVSMTVRMQRGTAAKAEYKVTAKPYRLTRNPGRAWQAKSPVRFYGFPDEVVAYYKNADFVQLLNLEQEKLFNSLFYLGPLRTRTERLYRWSGNRPESVGFDGQNAIAAMLAARDRKLNAGHKKRTRSFLELIAEKLAEMGLIEEFQVNAISAQRQEYEVKVRTKGSPDLVDLPDVGFGISQVLPVLVQCFYAPRGSVVLMEQPEIHLHPSAQSALADVMIEAINAREDGKDRNIQLIIETHSEHFLRRLQRRIADDTLPKEKVAAYFANTTKEKATLTPLEIDFFGNISNWPENFFGDEMSDITEQSKAAMKKRSTQKDSSSSGDSA